MIFGQLTEYDMKNIFLVSVTCWSKPFSKKSKLSISLDQQAEFMLKKDKRVFEGFSLRRRFSASYIKLRSGYHYCPTSFIKV